MTKVVFVAPDDLSVRIFCERFVEMLRPELGFDVVTVGELDQFVSDIEAFPSRHVDLPMKRFVSPIRDLAYLIRLFRLFQKEKPEAVICFTTKPNIYGIFAASLARVTSKTLAVRGLGRTFSPASGIADRIVNWLVRQLYRYACKIANHVWFTNEGDREVLETEGFVDSGKAFVTKNALFLPRYHPDAVSEKDRKALIEELRIGVDEHVIVMVARLIWEKGVREFVEAGQILRERGIRIRMLLVAPEESDSAGAVPVEWVREQEALGFVHWLGFRSDVLSLYSISDVAVLPSYYREGGYPRALLEPMAIGRPVIGADTDECRGPILDGKTGFLIPPRDGRMLADRIEELVMNPELARRMGRNARRRIESEFDDTSVVRQVLTTLGISEKLQ